MIVGSFNLRGLGSRVKRRKVRDLVRVENLDFLALQETKLESISDSLVHCLWGSDDCDWVSLPAVGNSGGILSIWRKSAMSVVFTFTGSGFAGVCLDSLQDQSRCFVINVYAKCLLAEKRRLWDEILMSRRGFGSGCWCVVSDFNSVREESERRGVGDGPSNGQVREMAEFDRFLEDLELVDLPLIGRRFTWFHPNGIAMSRLDRVLLSNEWLFKWGNPIVRVLPREVSDHCPLVVRYGNLDWGPKPFRFNNFWLQNKSFKELVVRTWEGQTFSGWMGFVLKDRLKGLKVCIKEWSAGVLGKPEEKKRQLVDKILELDIRSESSGISCEEVVMRKQLFDELWRLLKNIDASIFQRSRSKWLKEGDGNSRYFHSCINARKRGNAISVLRTAEGWVEGPVGVR
ncbi:LINE-1 reverse transcriptase like, partial [Trifolium medium]|nr:LINE-1 reverse transcriptase like [Trifolium medium]